MMLIATVILIFYIWTSFADGPRWGKLWSIVIGLMLVAGGAKVVLAGFSAVQASLFLSKSLLYIGCSAVLLLANRDSKVMQAFILMTALGLLPYFISRPKLPKPPAKFAQALDASGELILSCDAADLPGILQDYDLSKRQGFAPLDADATDLDDMYVVDVADGASVEEKISRLQQDARVRWVEYNETYAIPDLVGTAQPNRKAAPALCNDPLIKDQWAYSLLNLNAFHQQLSNAKPKRPARVFILDTGIEAKHEDLKAVYRSHKTTYDSDSRGHGTHCAGIAAAMSNNNLGVASFNPGPTWVQLTSVRVINTFGLAPQAAVINGIIEATDAGADVISLSLGGLSNDDIQHAYNQAVNYATERGVIVIASAGNSSRDAADFSPANADGVIAVAATDAQGRPASFTNTVENLNMGIAAPGVDIYSTDRRNKYSFKSGTSMAGPMVAGLAGVCKAIQPDIDHRAFYDLLNQTGFASAHAGSVGKSIQPSKTVEQLLQDQ